VTNTAESSISRIKYHRTSGLRRQTGCQVKEIADRLDSSTLEPITDTNNQLRDIEIAKLTIQMDGCVATDPFETVAQTGRFVLMRDNDTVAGGVLHEGTKAV
jgi:sulfate adenylyltransferase subunit 1 (EFTu-like GTPase family)